MEKKLLGFLTIALLYGIQIRAQVLFPMEIKGKFGYMDTNGTMMIPAMYDFADDYSEGYAVVALNRLPCVIDMNNQRIIDTGMYRYIGTCSEGVFAVTDFENHKKYIDARNQVLINLSDSIYEARGFRNGYAVLSRQLPHHEEKFGKIIGTVVFKFAYLSRNGALATGFEFDDADDFNSGYARIRKGAAFGLLNSRLKEVIPCEYTQVGDVSEGKIAINHKNVFGVMDTNGMWLIKPRFELIYPYSNGLAGFMEKNKFGFIDSKGNKVIPAVYEGIRPFSENKAAVQKDGKWGFINPQQVLVIKHVFENATVFQEGYCAVMYKRYWGFIDATGRLTVPTQYDAVGSFNRGVADVIYREIPAYVNRFGEVLPKLKK